MPTPRALLLGWLVVLLAERALELRRSARNAREELGAGGVEAGRGHYPALVLFHAAFLAACAVEPIVAPRPWPAGAAVAALAVAILAQALRWWTILTLGVRWTTRIVVVPGAPPVTTGPYRLLRHPNYVAVAAELLAVPLIGGAVCTAVAATMVDAILLAIRIPAEERALGADWRRAFARRRRPGGER